MARERWTFSKGEIAHAPPRHPTTNGNLQPKNSNTMGQEEIKKKLKNLQSSLVS
jgi:hypothetical protein